MFSKFLVNSVGVTRGLINKSFSLSSSGCAISRMISNNISSDSSLQGDIIEPVIRPIVICGPSGSGKSTLLKRLICDYQDYLGFTVSHTTRKPREGEIDGKDYHFTARELMEKAINENEFIEFTEFSGNLYGTSKKAMEHVQKSGKICILDLEIEGVKNMKKSSFKPLFIFVKPPSLEILEKRLRARATESEENLEKRLKRAKEDLNMEGIDNYFDLILINENIDEAYATLKNFIQPVIEAVKTTRTDRH